MNAPRATLAWVAVAGLVAAAAGVLLPFASPFGLAEGDDPVTMAVFGSVGFLWLAALLLTLSRQPASPLWKLMLALLVVTRLIWAFQFTPYPLLQGLAMSIAGVWPVLFVHVLVAYPSGHLRTRIDRLIVGAVYVLVVGGNLLTRAMWQPATDCPTGWCPQNLLLLWPNNDLSDRLGAAVQLSTPFLGGVVVWAVWRHWQAAAPAARRALVPVAVALPFAYVFNSIGYVAQALGNEQLQAAVHLPGLLADGVIPLGLLLGVLRLRLDRGRVAGLIIDLARGAPAGGLRDMLARALGDPTLQLAYATPELSGYIDGAGRPFQLPASQPGRAVARLERDGEPLAVLVHDSTIDEEDPGLVAAVSSAARLAIENERLTAQVRAQLEEVRASRSRIVAAADEERRKVERDLHDGAQQRLVALAMRLEQARAANVGSERLIDDATAELREAIAEVRGLARGVYPPILTEAGLAAAIESLAERASVPVEVRIRATRFAAAIEVTAYLVVAEALTNVARYSGATCASVDAAADGDALTVTISDDGRGGADPDRGTGLKGLRDRVAALGGTLDVASPAGGGTTVRVRLPLDGGSA